MTDNMKIMQPQEIVSTLIWNGWLVTRCGWDKDKFEWRSPRGISGSDWVSSDLYTIPAEVIVEAGVFGELKR
jgi:hypothetical protein